MRVLLGHRQHHPRARHPLPVVPRERDVVTLPPYDAWSVLGAEVEPIGAHATLDAALRAAGHFDGGAVTRGMTFLRWAPGTDGAARGVLRAALEPHGFRPPGGASWGA